MKSSEKAAYEADLQEARRLMFHLIQVFQVNRTKPRVASMALLMAMAGTVAEAPPEKLPGILGALHKDLERMIPLVRKNLQP